uniref:Transcription initiation factor TFIID subunit 13 n=1 Tax=Timspurckia oligopyrenoides TaxID=708627 RepID=A0A7S0ZEC8_9RHOD|mmetsp:Transcript_198/g.336  ORF Transcript_198/g.336 Transcript_198/m.336 type:complete len:132 (+) Transcript_198:391-786(+)
MSGEGVNEQDGAVTRRTLPRIFGAELRQMMYGFGDVAKPLPATIELMEEMLLEYLSALISKSVEIAQSRRRDRPNISDVKFVIRKDRRRMQRVRYLLDMKAEIERVTNIKTMSSSFEDAAGMVDDGTGPPV